MNILIRIIIMILSGIAIPYLANIIYEPMREFNELNKIEKILWILIYIFILNWFIVVPSMYFFECFRYIFIK